MKSPNTLIRLRIYDGTLRCVNEKVKRLSSSEEPFEPSWSKVTRKRKITLFDRWKEKLAYLGRCHRVTSKFMIQTYEA